MSGSISLYQDEFMSIMKAFSDKGYERIQDAPAFDITVVWKAPGTTKITTDVLKNCMLKDYSVSSSDGDLGNIMTSELLFSEIKRIFD